MRSAIPAFSLLIISYATLKASAVESNTAKSNCGCNYAVNICSNTTSCCAGLKCFQYPWYTQCKEDPRYIPAGPNSNCVGTDQYHCQTNSDCCNPAASCIENFCRLPCSVLPTIPPNLFSLSPSAVSTDDLSAPTLMPTVVPSVPTSTPTSWPTIPTLIPSSEPSFPSMTPSNSPSTQYPTVPSIVPTFIPTNPSVAPTVSTLIPTTDPTLSPSQQPLPSLLRPISLLSSAPSKSPSIHSLTRSQSPSISNHTNAVHNGSFISNKSNQIGVIIGVILFTLLIVLAVAYGVRRYRNKYKKREKDMGVWLENPAIHENSYFKPIGKNGEGAQDSMTPESNASFSESAAPTMRRRVSVRSPHEGKEGEMV